MDSIERYLPRTQATEHKPALRLKFGSVLASVALLASVAAAKHGPPTGFQKAQAQALNITGELDNSIDGASGRTVDVAAYILYDQGCVYDYPKGMLPDNIKDIYNPILFKDSPEFIGYVKPGALPAKVSANGWTGPTTDIAVARINTPPKPIGQDSALNFGNIYVPNKEQGCYAVYKALTPVWETVTRPGPGRSKVTSSDVFVVPGGVYGNINKIVNQPVGVPPAEAKLLIAEEKAALLRSAVGYVTFYGNRAS